MEETDLEIDFLEKEFLKCGKEYMPFPKPEITIYEEDVQAIMKTGCNRQIAEYSILKYKELEDKEYEKDKNYKKLSQLREEYYKIKNPLIEKVIEELSKAAESKSKNKLKEG